MSIDEPGPVAGPSVKAGILSRAYAAGRWAMAGEIVSRLTQPLVLFVLARLLEPQDFGVVTAAVMVLSFAQALWEAGLAKALVQTELPGEQMRSAASTAVWTNLVLAIVLYAVAYEAAPWIAAAFGDERAIALIRVQGLGIPMLAIGAVPLALFQRELRFRPIFWGRLAAAWVPGMVGIPIALLGGGYWALTIGSLAGTAFQVVVWLALSDRGLFRGWSAARLAALARFGQWSTGEAVVSWSMQWLDVFLIGLFLTSHELGLYRTSSMVVAMVFMMAIGSVMPVLYAALSRLKGDRAMMEAMFTRAVKASAMVGMLLAAIMVAAPAEWSAVLLGEEWREMGQVLRYLAVVQGISWLGAANAEFYRAMGRPDLNMKVIIGCLMFYAPFLAWAGQRGIEAFLIARLVAGVAGLMVHAVVTWRTAKISPMRLLREARWFIAGGLSAGLAGIVTNGRLNGDWQRAAGATAVALAVFGMVCWRERRFIADMFRDFRSIAPHASGD